MMENKINWIELNWATPTHAAPSNFDSLIFFCEKGLAQRVKNWYEAFSCFSFVTTLGGRGLKLQSLSIYYANVLCGGVCVSGGGGTFL